VKHTAPSETIAVYAQVIHAAAQLICSDIPSFWYVDPKHELPRRRLSEL
jgi:hypothetical protein